MPPPVASKVPPNAEAGGRAPEAPTALPRYASPRPRRRLRAPPGPAEEPRKRSTWPPSRRPAKSQSPHEINPTLYLKRMIEYEVTHEPGFAAVDEPCAQRLSVELYQLESGWTVFARYSGTEREEKVDHVELDEFTELAQRIAFSLLRNRPISHTITRENVLRADSETSLRSIDGTGHLLFGWAPTCEWLDCRPRRARGSPPSKAPPAHTVERPGRLSTKAPRLGPGRVRSPESGHREYRHSSQ